jgi:ATP-dependent helicase HrpB
MAHCRKRVTPAFPVDASLPELKLALGASRRAILTAPPGAGKTTRVPPALLNEPWLGKKKTLVLEPRRLAAVTCAAFMSKEFNEPVGQTIGYQIRMDKKTSPRTRIEVITQGVFIRQIQNDPSLAGAGLVIFDEFHERNLQNDLAFALCLDAMTAFCEDLRILVMSATMDSQAISRIMNHAPVIESTGKTYPVQTIYQPLKRPENNTSSIIKACYWAVGRALKESERDILVFLPGIGEIRQLKFLLDEKRDPDIVTFMLYGQMGHKDQAGVFTPVQKGQRKIVLATAIAETSVTIDGIGSVIDSGLMRVPLFSPQTGMTRLETISVSKAVADQRRGRAGRTAPGRCYRLWSEYDHQMLKPFTPPEVDQVDLAGLVLEMAAWGVQDPAQLTWPAMPEASKIDQARQLLKGLRSIDDNGVITAHGRKMVQLGLHPRLSHMIIMGTQMGQCRLACLIASLINEHDILVFDAKLEDPDIGLRLDVLIDMIDKKSIRRMGFDVKTRLSRQVIKNALQLERRMGCTTREKKDKFKPSARLDPYLAGDILALGFPDRIAKRRSTIANHYLMASGKGAYFKSQGPLSKHEYIIVIHLDGQKKNAAIFMAAPYSANALEKAYQSKIQTRHSVSWNSQKQSVMSIKQVCYEKIIIKEEQAPCNDEIKALGILLAQIKAHGLGVLPWTPKWLSFQARVAFLRQMDQFSDLPDLSDAALTENLDQWLGPFLTGIYSFKQLRDMALGPALESLLPWKEQQTVNTNAPTHLAVPSGSKKKLRYVDNGRMLSSPLLDVRLQEMFSLSQTPTIAGGTIPVTVCLLSPASRPVQVTNDLYSFWTNTYPEVKKDLMGRYPRHYWPDDPLSATPTSRVRPR